MALSFINSAMFRKFLCWFNFHKKVKKSIDGGPYAYEEWYEACARPGCQWQSKLKPYNQGDSKP